MADQAIKLVSAINTVNATQASLETFFAQIDQLDANVSGRGGGGQWAPSSRQRSRRTLLARAVGVPLQRLVIDCGSVCCTAAQLTELESVVAQLDLYSKRLQVTFQAVYK